MEQPTIAVRIGDSHLARTRSGDIIETVEFDADGQPDWDAGTLADPRGIGGEQGYNALRTAFDALERNAELTQDTTLITVS